MTRLAGVIGDPIGHSLSPRLHNHWLLRYDIDGHYIPLLVTADNLDAVLRLLPEMGFRGINVTLPHKEAVFKRANDLTDRARKMGAANTLTFNSGRILADNTDGFGFVEAISQQAGRSALELPATIIGAGGAARGIIVALQDAGCPEIRLINRTRRRAEALAQDLGSRIAVIDWSDAWATDTPALLVNTTSLGMVGQPPLDVDLADFPPGTVVCDIVYQPLETPLLLAAKRRGLKTVDGLGMLMHQATPGFEQWFGRRPKVDEDLRRAILP